MHVVATKTQKLLEEMDAHTKDVGQAVSNMSGVISVKELEDGHHRCRVIISSMNC